MSVSSWSSVGIPTPSNTGKSDDQSTPTQYASNGEKSTGEKSGTTNPDFSDDFLRSFHSGWRSQVDFFDKYVGLSEQELEELRQESLATWSLLWRAKHPEKVNQDPDQQVKSQMSGKENALGRGIIDSYALEEVCESRETLSERQNSLATVHSGSERKSDVQKDPEEKDQEFEQLLTNRRRMMQILEKEHELMKKKQEMDQNAEIGRYGIAMLQKEDQRQAERIQNLEIKMKVEDERNADVQSEVLRRIQKLEWELQKMKLGGLQTDGNGKISLEQVPASDPASTQGSRAKNSLEISHPAIPQGQTAGAILVIKQLTDAVHEAHLNAGDCVEIISHNVDKIGHCKVRSLRLGRLFKLEWSAFLPITAGGKCCCHKWQREDDCRCVYEGLKNSALPVRKLSDPLTVEGQMVGAFLCLQKPVETSGFKPGDCVEILAHHSNGVNCEVKSVRHGHTGCVPWSAFYSTKGPDPCSKVVADPESLAGQKIGAYLVIKQQTQEVWNARMRVGDCVELLCPKQDVQLCRVERLLVSIEIPWKSFYPVSEPGKCWCSEDEEAKNQCRCVYDGPLRLPEVSPMASPSGSDFWKICDPGTPEGQSVGAILVIKQDRRPDFLRDEAFRVGDCVRILDHKRNGTCKVRSIRHGGGSVLNWSCFFKAGETRWTYAMY